MNTINRILELFLAFNQNAFYSVIYFIKYYWFYLFVIVAIIVLISFELNTASQKYVDDQRNML